MVNRSHSLPDTATQMWLFVNDCLLTGLKSKSSLPVTKYTVTVCQTILVLFFYQEISLIIL